MAPLSLTQPLTVLARARARAGDERWREPLERAAVLAEGGPELQRLSFGFHDRIHSGDLITRGMLDLEGTRIFIQQGMLQAGSLLLLLSFSVYMMVRTDLAMAAIGNFDVKSYEKNGIRFVDAIDPALPADTYARVAKSFAREPEILKFLSGYFGPYPFRAAGGSVASIRRKAASAWPTTWSIL